MIIRNPQALAILLSFWGMHCWESFSFYSPSVQFNKWQSYTLSVPSKTRVFQKNCVRSVLYNEGCFVNIGTCNCISRYQVPITTILQRNRKSPWLTLQPSPLDWRGFFWCNNLFLWVLVEHKCDSDPLW